MTEEQIDRIVGILPSEQREEARYRIMRALLDNVENIGLCTYDEPADITDLVGNCPRYREELRSKGDELSSGFISLSRYSSDKV